MDVEKMRARIAQLRGQVDVLNSLANSMEELLPKKPAEIIEEDIVIVDDDLLPEEPTPLPVAARQAVSSEDFQKDISDAIANLLRG